MQSFKADPNKEKAIELCMKTGLMVKDVTKVDDYGETRLLAACADGVTYEAL